MLPFISDILSHHSLSIVGLEKNTGKTECLKYVLAHLPVEQKRVAVTSIGIDGETTDQVTRTQKPEIVLRSGMYFGTSEAHYRQRRLVSELIDVSDEFTSLGRVVTARTVIDGKILLSGPASSAGLKRWIASTRRFGIDLAIVDGALSRLSSASPAVSESMILATGAAYSTRISTLVQKTAHVVNLINLPLASAEHIALFDPLEKGIYYADADGTLHDLKAHTALASDIHLDGVQHCTALYVAGALVGGLLEKIRSNKQLRDAEVVVRDFTRVFVTPQQLQLFTRSGGRLSVLQRSKLIAVTVNPTAPGGVVLDSRQLCDMLGNAIGLPVYDLLKNDPCN